MASCCCSACNKICGVANSKSERFHKLQYTVLVFCCVVVGIVLRNYRGNFFITLYEGVNVQTCSDACKGDQAVYRIFLTLTLFHAAHFAAVALLPYKWGRAIHTTWFGVKFLAFFGLLIAMFNIDNKNASDFASACRIIALLFIVFQSVVVIDYAHSMSQWMVRKGDEDRKWDYINLGSCAGIFITSIVFLSLFFTWFARDGTCGVQKFVLSMSIIVPVGFTILSIFVELGALFPSAAITGYTTYLAYTALVSSDAPCNSFAGRASDNNWDMGIGIVIAALSIAFTTWNLGESSSNLFGAKKESEQEANLLDNMDNKDSGDGESGEKQRDEDQDEDEDDEDSEEAEAAQRRKTINACVFHLLLTIAAMYSCMLLTAWSTNDYSTTQSRYQSNESFWVKVASQWLVFFLYIWTLVAPTLFPDREWD